MFEEFVLGGLNLNIKKINSSRLSMGISEKIGTKTAINNISMALKLDVKDLRISDIDVLLTI